jgi:hypothetical protein
LSIPASLAAEGWTHIGDPDSADGYIIDAYQGSSSGNTKMYLLTTPSGSTYQYTHTLAPGELYNGSTVTGTVTDLGSIPQSSIFSGTFEPEGIDYDTATARSGSRSPSPASAGSRPRSTPTNAASEPANAASEPAGLGQVSWTRAASRFRTR